MRKRIPKADPTNLPQKRPRGARPFNEAVQWESKILLCLEAKDPKLLDKETQKVYRKIHGTGARIQGPVPLPVRHLPGGAMALETERIHRRLFHIFFPTERTVSLLEKLALSGAVETSISVEEIPARATRSARGGDVEKKEEPVS
jgi:small subunit ribosomal protein S10